MDFISKKAKFDIYLLLLSVIIIFIRKKSKIVQVYKINKLHIYHLLKTNINISIKLKICISNNYFLML